MQRVEAQARRDRAASAHEAQDGEKQVEADQGSDSPDDAVEPDVDDELAADAA